MYSWVERHSLCPVFTSFEFKWPSGRLQLPFTSHHLHFPLHTVHSQLLITPHPFTLHTLSPYSHIYSTTAVSDHMLFFFFSSYFQCKQKYTKLYKPLMTSHKHRCAQGINTACSHICFCLNFHFSFSLLQ